MIKTPPRTPLLDKRTSEDIYIQSLELAKRFCPEWANKNWSKSHFDRDDPGLVVFKLFSNLAEFLILQMNKKPDKYRIAFFDFMGIDMNLAKPTIVPLTFKLIKGKNWAFVLHATEVVSNKSDVVFKTMKYLSVVNMSSVFSLNPWEDSYTDHSNDISGKGDAFFIFGNDKKEKRIDHILCLGDERLFSFKRTPELFRITFTGSNLERDFFGQWCTGKDTVCNIKVNISKPESNETLTFKLEGLEKIPSLSIEKNESPNFWLSIRPDKKMKLVKGVELPSISEIVVDITVKNIQPDFIFYNDLPLDIKKGFYPFGEMPKTNDTFYIGSEEAFSKKNAEIEFIFGITRVVLENKSDVLPKLSWEYWNGKWKNLDLIKNTTEAFSKEGQISFNCPDTIPVEIQGKLTRWIRLRIESGNYGNSSDCKPKPVDEIINKLNLENKDEIKKELQKENITFGIYYTESTLNPPFIKSVSLGYKYNTEQVTNIRTYNNFQCANFNDKVTFAPYKLPEEEQPALYIGFEYEKSVPGSSISLYFALKEKTCGELIKEIRDPAKQENINQVSDFIWEYNNESIWKKLEFEDKTAFFSSSGIISFQIPPDIRNIDKFNKNLCWIRVRPRKGEKLTCPKLNGIYANTVWAVNLLNVENEILGSGNGKPGLSFSFSRKPVLENQVIEIKEDVPISEDQAKIIHEEEGTDAIRKIYDEKTGELKEVWVRWHAVNNFYLSSSLKRHYILDHSRGMITFGDGTRGILPPKGRNNIVAKIYRTTGGKKGNLDPGTIKVLKKPIENIESVINYFSSSGGSDQEDLENAVTRAPHTIKNRNRAITLEDFELLAFEVSPDVLRAKCIPGDNITVFILPSKETETPQPDAGLKESVEKYLKEKALFTIRDRIKVVGPEYKSIDLKVNIIIQFKYLNESSIIEEKIKGELKRFLHPLHGGRDGKGWDFGTDIYYSEIGAVIEAIEGVDYIENIETGKITIKENELPCAGNIEIEIYK